MLPRTPLQALLIPALVITLATAVEAGTNTWTSNGPEGGFITASVIEPTNPDVLYVGTFNKGVFKSVDAGASWSPTSSAIIPHEIRALVIDPASSSTIYAGTFFGGVFKSVDAGANWTPISAGLNLFINALAIDGTNPDILYAGTASSGVFKSLNGGMTPNTCLAPDSAGEPSQMTGEKAARALPGDLAEGSPTHASHLILILQPDQKSASNTSYGSISFSGLMIRSKL